jgi:hypothetical protein
LSSSIKVILAIIFEDFLSFLCIKGSISIAQLNEGLLRKATSRAYLVHWRRFRELNKLPALSDDAIILNPIPGSHLYDVNMSSFLRPTIKKVTGFLQFAHQIRESWTHRFERFEEVPRSLEMLEGNRFILYYFVFHSTHSI